MLSQGIPEVVSNHPVKAIVRTEDSVEIIGKGGYRRRFDHVVIAAHADQALKMLADPSNDERRLLGAFNYIVNDTVLHTDPRLMPLRRRVWSSWNYMTRDDDDGRRLAVTYWMNRLQAIESDRPLFVTLNPHREIEADAILKRMSYSHPRFDAVAMKAQKELWSLQGHRNTWFCGAYFGAGFHEDGLQAGLAVAEALGGVRRPWTVPDESGRIHLYRGEPNLQEAEAA
jgi:predicted NAD/FAD-binding protein